VESREPFSCNPTLPIGRVVNRVNFGKGFVRIYLVVQVCWLVGWTFFIGAYDPWARADNERQWEQEKEWSTYTDCGRDVVKKGAGKLQIIEGKATVVEPSHPYGLRDGLPVTKEEALARCESDRALSQKQWAKRNYLREQYTDLLTSLKDPDVIGFFALVLMFPALVFLLLRCMVWGVVTIGRWVGGGFVDPKKL
jgi:hypothetical protein